MRQQAELASWTLEELGARVAEALAIDYPGPSNGQVRAIPDRRTIRYYASLGLIERPGASRGRTALYGRRHLLQLVAIKRLQARGCSLQQVQEQLLGIAAAALEQLARVPASQPDQTAAPAAPVATRRRQGFWRDAPAAVTAAAPLEATPAAAPAALAMTLVPLEGAASLLLPGAQLSAEELDRIRAAAQPLVEELRARGLLAEPDHGAAPRGRSGGPASDRDPQRKGVK
jgi:DNA-binding transcriptional MerR regulator